MLLSFFSFFRFLDENNKLSLTNLCVMGALGKVLTSNSVDGFSSTALGMALLGYVAKKGLLLYQVHKAKPQLSAQEVSDEVTKLREELEQIKGKVSNLSLAAGLKHRIQG